MIDVDTMQLCVQAKDVESLVICLAIGTLRAMQRGALATEAGIWCLGRPCFWEPLRARGLLSNEVVDVLSGADELDALGKYAGADVLSTALREALATLEKRLRELADPLWHATWARAQGAW